MPTRPRSPSIMMQPDGITCGPTCLAMVADFLRRRAGGTLRLGISQIATMCGTNPQTGTTHDAIMTGLAGLGISYRRSVGDPEAVAAITERVARGDIVLLRTLTQGIPHWTLAHDWDGRRFSVADPWLGEIELHPHEVEERIRPREWEHFVIGRDQPAADIELRPLMTEPLHQTRDERRTMETVLAAVERTFGPACGGETSWIRPCTVSSTDWHLSHALWVDGRLAGFYLLNAMPISEVLAATPGAAKADLSQFDSLEGVEGIALVVDPAMRGRGYGRLLRAVPLELGFDYVYGKQLKSLGNLPNWLRHRTLVADCGSFWVTAAMLPAREPDATPEAAKEAEVGAPGP